MSHPTDDTPNPVTDPDWSAEPEPEPAPAEAEAATQADAEAEASTTPAFEVEEQTPAGGPASPEPAPEPEPEPEPEPIAEEPAAEVEPAIEAKAPPVKEKTKKARPAPATPAPAPTSAPVAAQAQAATATAVDDDDEEKPQLVGYVLKVQSSREDTIRDALERRVKIQGLQRYFNRIVVPTEKTTEIRNNKKKIVERKTYPGYIMVEMELNEKTWFVVRETPGVGDFVGAHGTPTKMTETEVNQMLGQETAKTEEAPRVRIDVERGDRVKIKDGPFENFEGTVEEVIEARGLVKVMLIIFNRPTPVDLEYWQVERI
jgi:transcription termination/antitermination protein NusG